MEEIQEQNQALEPEKTVEQGFQTQIQQQVSDNPNPQIPNEGQAQAPSELILGKFKSVDDLSKAYKELEKHQGSQSAELGNLRQHSAMFNGIQNLWNTADEVRASQAELMETAKKYQDYFLNPTFREMYKEAYSVLGKNLDTERFVSMIEDYVSSRIFAHEKSRSAKNETEKVINSMSFVKNETSSLTPPKKRLDEMTPKEVDELLERLI